MEPIDMDRDFAILSQRGPFATLDIPPQIKLFSDEARIWTRNLTMNRMVTRYRAIRNQIFDILNIKSYSDIQALIKDTKRRSEISKRAYLMLGKMYGVEGSEGEIITHIIGYAQVADDVIDYLKKGIFSDYASDIEMTNEIESIKDPVELLLIIFNDRYHKKTRFDAKRKLILMSLVGSIDQRERETDIENKFSKFHDFLNDYVWSPDLKIGEYKTTLLLSTHDRDTFKCTDIKLIDGKEAHEIEVKPYQKLTLLKRRSFNAGGRRIPIYVTVRRKFPEAKVLKLLRKGMKNPAIAVDDELGLMAVFDSIRDIKTFQRHLTESAARAGTFMTLEEISNTLGGGMYHAQNTGSSPYVRMLKFFAKMGGMRVEFIIHTNESYINYLYQRDISHGEYEIRRLIDSGVAELLFPKDIYGIDMASIKETMIQKYRKRIEEV